MNTRAEAEDRYGTPLEGGRAETAMRMGFTAGAEWALQEAAARIPDDIHDPRHIADWLRALAEES